MGLRITTTQRTNAFRIQSPRLQYSVAMLGLGNLDFRMSANLPDVNSGRFATYPCSGFWGEVKVSERQPTVETQRESSNPSLAHTAH